MPKPLKTQRVSTPDRKGVFGQGAKALRVGRYARVSTHDQEDTAPAALCDAGLCKEEALGRLVSALIKHAKKLPTELYQSLIWDRGLELAEHRRFTLATDIDVYFCDPQSP